MLHTPHERSPRNDGGIAFCELVKACQDLMALFHTATTSAGGCCAVDTWADQTVLASQDRACLHRGHRNDGLRSTLVAVVAQRFSVVALVDSNDLQRLRGRPRWLDGMLASFRRGCA